MDHFKSRAKAIHNIQSFLSNCVQYSSLGPSCQLRSRWTGKFGLGCQVWAKLPENYKTWLMAFSAYLRISRAILGRAISIKYKGASRSRRDQGIAILRFFVFVQLRAFDQPLKLVFWANNNNSNNKKTKTMSVTGATTTTTQK